MTEPVALAAAARACGLSLSQARRDVVGGAPVVRRGSVGRGHGTLVDLDAYRRWRNREFDSGRVMEAVAAALADTLKRDGGLGEPAHVSLGIRGRAAAAYLCCAWERLHRAVTGHDAASLPPDIAHAVREMPRWRP